VFALAVVSGTQDLSLPLVWSVSDPALGQITHSSGYSAAYARTAINGVNNITVRDQYGLDGVATVNQVADDTDPPGTPAATTPTTPATPTPTPQPNANAITVSVSGFRITVNNLFSDGSGHTVNTQIPGQAALPSGMDLTVESGGETHQLRLSNISYGVGGVTGFRLVVDGSTTITYP